MDSEWRDEDQHRRRHQTPKLILAGQVDLLINGQPCTLTGEGHNLFVEARSLRTLFSLKASWTSTLTPLQATMAWLHLRVFVRAGGSGLWKCFPIRRVGFVGSFLVMLRVVLFGETPNTTPDWIPGCRG